MRQAIHGKFLGKNGDTISHFLSIAVPYLSALFLALVNSISLGWLVLGLGFGIVTGCIGGILDVKTMDGTVVTFKGSKRLFNLQLLAIGLLITPFGFLGVLPPAVIGSLPSAVVVSLFYAVIANGLMLLGTFTLVDILFLYSYHRRQGPFLVITGYRYEDTTFTETSAVKMKAKIKPRIDSVEDEE